MFDPAAPVARLVLDHPACAPVLHRHHIDYCCRGEVPLEAAAERQGIELRGLLRELEHAIERAEGVAGADPRERSTPDLIDHIVRAHHGYVRDALPFLVGLAAKVARVHGEHAPYLVTLANDVAALAELLLPHLAAEEETLFPLLQRAHAEPAQVARALDAMRAEHAAVGALLGRLRATAREFECPDGACNSYRTLFAELPRLEADLLTHVHLENHVLAPRFEGR